jgi:mxaJ protein
MCFLSRSRLLKKLSATIRSIGSLCNLRGSLCLPGELTSKPFTTEAQRDLGRNQVLWLQRSQMFIDHVARHGPALQRSAMFQRILTTVYVSLRRSEDHFFSLASSINISVLRDDGNRIGNFAQKTSSCGLVTQRPKRSHKEDSINFARSFFPQPAKGDLRVALRPVLKSTSVLFVSFWFCVVLGACGAKPAPPSISQASISPPPSANSAPTQSTAPSSARRDVLRVCADPNNLPFSNRRQQGFENKIAELVARELKVKVEYTWWAQRRGFIRNTLKAGLCDLIIGMPSSLELALTTAPYYRSTYAFVFRKDSHYDLHSFDDELLKYVRVGVQLIGDDFANSPPAHALSNRNIIQNVKGYSVYGDYNEPNPPARIIEAVAKHEIDVAVVWGPLAGYFAKRQGVPITLVPVSPRIDLPYLPFVYDISMGVRREDTDFKDKLEIILTGKSHEIGKILDEYHVPRGPVI